MLLSVNNIKSELSYAYLHAIAARAGLGCEVSGRHSDGAGVDASLRAKERFAADSIFTEFTVEVQLKATSIKPASNLGRFSFPLALDHYNKLRSEDTQSQRLLVVLFLPEDESQWLIHSPDGLIARRCAYWVSLRGAPDSPNESSQTVYLPETNPLSVQGLRTVFAEVSRNVKLNHVL